MAYGFQNHRFLTLGPENWQNDFPYWFFPKSGIHKLICNDPFSSNFGAGQHCRKFWPRVTKPAFGYGESNSAPSVPISMADSEQDSLFTEIQCPHFLRRVKIPIKPLYLFNFISAAVILLPRKYPGDGGCLLRPGILLFGRRNFPRIPELWPTLQIWVPFQFQPFPEPHRSIWQPISTGPTVAKIPARPST